MHKLSQNYRNDPSDPLPLKFRVEIDKVYIPTLKNLSVENPKILVVYSGGNAVGKSSLSTRIGNELGGLVLENDAIKRTIIKVFPGMDSSDELNPLTWRYSMELYGRLNDLTLNGLVVRDGIIDWYYDRILPIFENMGYKIFVVQFDISTDKAIEAIMKRGDLPTVKVETLLKQLDDHKIHQSRFRSRYNADVVLSEDNLFNHTAVIEKLREQISVFRASSS